MTNEKEKELILKFPKILWVIPILLLVGVGGCMLFGTSQYVSTEDAYIDTNIVTVSPKVNGQLIEVLVEDNQKVRKGQLVARIEPDDYKLKLAQITAKYNQALLNQKNAKAVNLASKTNIATAKEDFERQKGLYLDGAASKQQYDLAKANYEKAKADLTTSSENLLTKGGKSVADAQIQELRAMKSQAELYLSYTNIYAPCDGTVASKRATAGMYVAPGSPLFAIVPDNVWVVANFKENQLENIKEGQEVNIKIDSFPHQKFYGKVDSIQRASGAKASLFPPENAVGSFVKVVQRVPVKIVFTDIPDGYQNRIAPGMSAVPKVRVK